MKLSEKTQTVLWGIFGAVLLISAAAWMILNPGPEHIEDTNGPENFALQQITEEDVVAAKMGTRGGPSTSEIHWDFGPLNVSSGMKYSGKKFTGVYRLYTATFFKGSDIHVFLADFQINGGNFIHRHRKIDHGCSVFVVDVLAYFSF